MTEENRAGRDRESRAGRSKGSGGAGENKAGESEAGWRQSKGKERMTEPGEGKEAEEAEPGGRGAIDLKKQRQDALEIEGAAAGSRRGRGAF